jgi:hypothetical protein
MMSILGLQYHSACSNRFWCDIWMSQNLKNCIIVFRNIRRLTMLGSFNFDSPLLELMFSLIFYPSVIAKISALQIYFSLMLYHIIGCLCDFSNRTCSCSFRYSGRSKILIIDFQNSRLNSFAISTQIFPAFQSMHNVWRQIVHWHMDLIQCQSLRHIRRMSIIPLCSTWFRQRPYP